MKTPGERARRRSRANLLRNPPPRPQGPAARSEWIAIMSELNLIHNNPALDGDTKHTLFTRGAKQLAGII